MKERNEKKQKKKETKEKVEEITGYRTFTFALSLRQSNNLEQ